MSNKVILCMFVACTTLALVIKNYEAAVGWFCAALVQVNYVIVLMEKNDE